MAKSDNRDREVLLRGVRAYLRSTHSLTQRTGLVEEIARAAYQQAMEEGTVAEQIVTKRCLQDVKKAHSWALRQSIREAASDTADVLERPPSPGSGGRPR